MPKASHPLRLSELANVLIGLEGVAVKAGDKRQREEAAW